MTELLTAAQMRALEQAAMDSGEVTGLELMERAGQGVVAAILEEWPEFAKTSHRAVVLCGPGNNGGDGFVVARLLKESGWEVDVFLYGDPEKMPTDARANYNRWLDMDTVEPMIEGILAASPKSDDGEHTFASLFPNRFDLIVDAIFGGGLNRNLPDDLRGLMHGTFANPSNAHKTVAIDGPTGLCLDSGRAFDLFETTVAGLTVTFHRERTGHYLEDGPRFCGKVGVVDIRLDDVYSTAKKKPSNQNAKLRKTFNASKQQQVLKVGVRADSLAKDPTSHKYYNGHAVVLAGGPGRGGAARLAARGALRIGAGLVTVACPSDALTENAAQLNAIMLRALDDAEALTDLLADDRLNAVCLGPGLGTTHSTRNMVNAVLAAARSTVLDADALTTFADAPEALFERLHSDCVLTPHAGEFARLFPDIAEKLAEPTTRGPAYSKLDATRDAAQRAGCTVLFKGPDTVIANQHGEARINSAYYDRKAPWLATAGAGDVLAGFITGLLARGQSPLHAAATAAWLHVECARSFGPGLIAEDLPEKLPDVLSAMLTPSD